MSRGLLMFLFIRAYIKRAVVAVQKQVGIVPPLSESKNKKEIRNNALPSSSSKKTIDLRDIASRK